MEHSHKWITDLCIDDITYSNKRFEFIDKRLARIEEKLFTDKETIDFFLQDSDIDLSALLMKEE